MKPLLSLLLLLIVVSYAEARQDISICTSGDIECPCFRSNGVMSYEAWCAKYFEKEPEVDRNIYFGQLKRPMYTLLDDKGYALLTVSDGGYRTSIYCHNNKPIQLIVIYPDGSSRTWKDVCGK